MPSVRGGFLNTHWSEVVAAGDTASPKSSAALESLCRSYWYPLYAYVRRKGYNSHDAEDLTQGFFTKLLERNYLTTADRTRGKFRSFLLGSFEHFLAREWTRAHAQKRGAGKVDFSLDGPAGAARYSQEPVDGVTPQVIFERRWATTILERAHAALQAEYAARGLHEQFKQMETVLGSPSRERSYADLCQELGMSEGAFKVAVCRLRQRYGELIRAEIAQTVVEPGEIEDELNYLLMILRG